MDVVMLAQHGVGNAVATLGTATTPDHVRKLLRLVDRVVFSFDGDAAGRKAAWRALEACLPQASDTKSVEFLFLPEGHDPDSFVREAGADGMRRALAEATPLSRFLVDEITGQVDLETVEGRARLQALAGPLLAQLSAPGLLLQLTHRVAELARISVTELERYLSSSGRHGRALPPSQAHGRGSVPEPSRAQHGRASPQRGERGETRSFHRGAALPDLERRARALTALRPNLVSAPQLERDWLSDSLLAWFDAIAQLPPDASLALACEALREEWGQEVAAIEGDIARDWDGLSEFAPGELQTEFDGALAQLRDRALRQAINELVARGLESDADRARYQELMALQRRT